MRSAVTQRNRHKKATLYSVVFDSVSMRYVATFVFLFFVIHPVMPAFAAVTGGVQPSSAESENTTINVPEMEGEVETQLQPESEIEQQKETENLPEVELVDSEAETEVSLLSAEEQLDEPVVSDVSSTSETTVVQVSTRSVGTGSSSEDVQDIPITQEAEAGETSSEADTVLVSENIPATTTVIQASSSQQVSSSTGTVAGVATTTEPENGNESEVATVVENTDPSTVNEEVEVSAPVEESKIYPEETLSDSTTDEHEQSDTESDTTSKEDELHEMVPAPEYFEIGGELTHSDNHYQFQKTQCVSMGDGGYYCAEKQLMDIDNSVDDSLYTALDAEGDMEIYLRTKGKVEQITDNTFDDSAPYYDAISDSIVWHRLISGRYQVMSFEDGEETQITQTRNNSMEPKRSGEYTVWQEWVIDNWEVMLFDGTQTIQLTDSALHDVAPYVQGGYVIWTTTDGQKNTVSVYDIQTGLFSEIHQSDGGRVENPRFVLVYDEKLDNGDVITKGFNPETGEVTPLSAQPGSVPDKIPSSDPTGETRALIQNKPGGREDFSDAIDPNSATTTTGTSTTNSAAETVVATSSKDIVVRTQIVNDDVAQAPTATSSDALPLTDFDIIVEPFSASSSAHESGVASSTDAVE